MNVRRISGWVVAFGVALIAGLPGLAYAQQTASSPEVTFTKDIAPVLQRSCENCHRPNGAGPMPLQSYEDVRPWARAIKRAPASDRAPA